MSIFDTIGFIGGTILALLLDAVVAVLLTAIPLAALVVLDLAPIGIAYGVLGFVASLAALRVLFVATVKFLSD
jgi:hypothetical protein